MASFRKELTELINKHSVENLTNTPDYILAEFMYFCLIAFETGIRSRDDFFSMTKDLHEGVQTDPPNARPIR
jgi:hypothetical protein